MTTLVTISTLLVLALAGAQPATPVRPIEPGRGDAGPLGTSLRELPAGLRAPSGFEHVYRLDAPSLDGREWFYRADGGLTAVFPRSAYSPMGEGVMKAEIPPGTTFYLSPLAPARAFQPRQSEDLRIRESPPPIVRHAGRAGGSAPGEPAAEPWPGPGTFADDARRSARVRALLDAALAAGRGS